MAAVASPRPQGCRRVGGNGQKRGSDVDRETLFFWIVRPECSLGLPENAERIFDNPYVFVQLGSGSNSVIFSAISAVSGPRSFW